MSCNCSNYQPIELSRASILERIRKSPRIRKNLEQLAEIPELYVALFRCRECGQFWQSGREWNSHFKEYLFQVPAIEIVEWMREPYRQPAAMMIYSAMMSDYFSRASFETRDEACRVNGCTHKALKTSVFCRDHHIEEMQRLKRLPKEPIGRFFPPYYKAESTWIE